MISPGRVNLKRTPHRQEREDPKRERNNLRQQNRLLKRKVARLQKSVRELEGRDEDDTIDEELEQEPEQEQVETCPKCGSADLGNWTAPSGKVVIGCRSCKKFRASR